jgi:hypothetical protein
VHLAKPSEPISEGWQAGCPVLLKRRGRFWLHTPLEKKFETPAKAVDQVATDPQLRLCAIDLNLGDTQAVCTIVQADGTVGATLFIRGGDFLHARTPV